jgi:hypothetical protein
MDAKEYIRQHGQAAYDFLSEKAKENLGTPAPTREQSAGSRGFDGNKVLLAEEEKIIRSYHASHMKFPPCEGYLTITNKRMIFRGEGGSSFVMDEVKIDSVSGFTSFCGSRFISILAFLGGLLSLYGLVNISQSFRYSVDMTGVLILIAGVAMLFFSRREIFMLKVFSSQALGGAIEIGEGLGAAGPLSTIMGGSAVYSLVGRPTVHTRTMLGELGAIVRDLQTLDEESVLSKWGGNTAKWG